MSKRQQTLRKPAQPEAGCSTLGVGKAARGEAQKPDHVSGTGLPYAGPPPSCLLRPTALALAIVTPIGSLTARSGRWRGQGLTSEQPPSFNGRKASSAGIVARSL